MRFSVGQRVRVNCPQSRLHGEEVTIISPLRFGRVRLHPGAPVHDAHYYEVDRRSIYSGKPCAFEPHELIPLDDPPELGSWDALARIWVPRGVSA